jgi:hypothetical protein
MPFSRIKSAQLIPGGKEVSVSGPMEFAPEQAGTDVLSITFVLVRGANFAHGIVVPDGAGAIWTKTVPVFGTFHVGDTVQAFGVAMLLSPEDVDTPTRIVETLTWSEPLRIKGA